MTDLVDLLNTNNVIEELCLGSNMISNDGISTLAKFLGSNSTLRHLDICKNSFSDIGFEPFARAMGVNRGITHLDISKNNHITDNGSLLYLVDSLITNETLQKLDLSGLQARKPFFVRKFKAAL